MLSKLTIFLLLCATAESQDCGQQNTRKLVTQRFTYTTLKPFAVIVDVNADAKKIFDSNLEANVVASILPFRNPAQCVQINDQYMALNGGSALVADDYVPYTDFEATYTDLLFALTKDENTVLSMFLGKFCEEKDATHISIVLTLVKDMDQFKEVYASQHGKDLNGGKDNQKSPFKNLMRVWIEHSRDPDGPVDQAAVNTDAVGLIQEQPGWDENRDYIETVLIRKSLSHAKAVLISYSEKNNNDIKTDIANIIQNDHLKYAYTGLAQYIEDKYTYMAMALHDNVDPNVHHWSIWIIIVSITRDNDLPLVKEAFKKLYDIAMADFFLQQNGDHEFMETMATIISSCHSPTLGGPPGPPTQPPISSQDPNATR